jgi:hypothetical protein
MKNIIEKSLVKWKNTLSKLDKLDFFKISILLTKLIIHV